MSKNDDRQNESITLSRKDLEEMMAMTAATAAKVLGDAMRPPNEEDRLKAIEAKIAGQQRCGECGQTRAGCGGKHREMVVWPSYMASERFFQGVKINGVTYRSQHAGHRIIVPADAAIEHAIGQWDKREQILQTGRKKNHNSGSIGTAGSNVRPANGTGWSV